MLGYIDIDGDKEIDDYDTIEQKNKIIERFHNNAKRVMREQNRTEFTYSIIDFEKKSSLVYVLNREVTETFSLTGY